MFRHNKIYLYYIFFVIYLVVCFFWLSCSGPPRYTHGPHTTQPSRPPHKNPKKQKKPTVASDTLQTTKKYQTPSTFKIKGKASYYGGKFHGRKTASGEYFNQYEMTAAHKTLPFGTMVKVTNLTNNRTVIVRINDRGPFKANRIIDVSLAAAKQLDMIQQGIVPVTIAVVSSLSD